VEPLVISDLFISLYLITNNEKREFDEKFPLALYASTYQEELIE
jgi:hypothetical protein